MTRVHVICEGQTEEMFVNEVLAEQFLTQGIHLTPSLVGKPGHKGGDFRFARLFHDVRARLLSDKSAYCTTLFDFYGLPPTFPGKSMAKRKRNHADKAQCILQAISGVRQAPARHLGRDPNRPRQDPPTMPVVRWMGQAFTIPGKERQPLRGDTRQSRGDKTEAREATKEPCSRT